MPDYLSLDFLIAIISAKLAIVAPRLQDVLLRRVHYRER